MAWSSGGGKPRAQVAACHGGCLLSRTWAVRENVGPVNEFIFVPAREPGSAPLVLLHGSDGRETDLLPLAERLGPSMAKISIRGAVATPGGYAFFHRFADRRGEEENEQDHPDGAGRPVLHRPGDPRRWRTHARRLEDEVHPVRRRGR